MILTGFEPFTTGQGLVLSHNPTADIAARVAERVAGVQGAVLPVSFERTPAALEALFSQHPARVWIGLGYAPHRAQLDVEVVALNAAHALRGDNDGACPQDQAVIPGAPTAYRSSIDLDLVREAFAAQGIQAARSFHAGTFLCNQVFYLGCHRQAQDHLDVAAFIHVPPMPDYAPFEAGLAEICRRYVRQEGPR